MTHFLLGLIRKSHPDPKTPAARTAVGKLSGLVGIICNLLLACGKLAAGILASSVSITADALNNFSDAVSSIVTLVGFRLAELPADTNHPYGHARFEYLSGLAVSTIIIVVGFELGESSVRKIIHPTAVEFSALTAVILLISIAVKLWMSRFSRELGKMIGSSALSAAAADSRNDVIATAAVLAAALTEHFTNWNIDGYMGLAVALFILVSGWNLAKEAISPLLGEAASPELKQAIVDYIGQNPKVLGFHDLMVHDYGPGQRFASIHVEMDQKEDPLACHGIIDDMERECLQSHGVHLVIHYDPVVTNDPVLDRLHQLASSILKMRDSQLSLHDFRMVPSGKDTNLIFDVVLPPDLMGQEQDIQSALEDALNSLGEGTFHTVITFDTPC